MKRTGVGRFSAVFLFAGASRAGTQTDPRAIVGSKRHVLLELQWQSRGGRFRHFVLSQRGLRRVLGAFSIVIMLTLGIVGVFTVGSNRIQAGFDVDTVLRENGELKAQEFVLREKAIILAKHLYWRVELERRKTRLLHNSVHAWDLQCPPPPSTNASTEETLTWLSLHGARLEAIENQLAADRVDICRKWASIATPVGGGTLQTRDPAVFEVADTGH